MLIDISCYGSAPHFVECVDASLLVKIYYDTAEVEEKKPPPAALQRDGVKLPCVIFI
jgi:hypothetical protein